MAAVPRHRLILSPRALRGCPTRPVDLVPRRRVIRGGSEPRLAVSAMSSLGERVLWTCVRYCPWRGRGARS